LEVERERPVLVGDGNAYRPYLRDVDPGTGLGHFHLLLQFFDVRADGPRTSFLRDSGHSIRSRTPQGMASDARVLRLGGPRAGNAGGAVTQATRLWSGMLGLSGPCRPGRGDTDGTAPPRPGLGASA